MLVALFASLLPRRAWPALEERYPVRAMAPVSAVLTAGASFWLGLHGFLAYASRTADAAVAATSEIGASMSLSALSLGAFAFLTPLGWLSSYLFLSGLLRALLSVTGEIGGDPLLSLLDAPLHRVSERRAFERAAADRARWEGPEMPDLVARGDDLGLDAPFVVVASRLKPGWEKGVTVVTPRQWFRLGPREDRRQPDGLRALYPLYPMGQAEVIRRSVGYDHPAFSTPPVEDPGPMREAKH